MLVVGPHRPELQECIAHVVTEVVLTLLGQDSLEADVAAVDDIDALHVLQRNSPVWSGLADDHLKLGEGVVDPVVARERVADERLF